ncbi:hypothetical protein [Paenibacillus sp. R14(2021)]|uniref:hypothetical protein n=1 Tax=Paenibacillus sp. R14(2021) TaxID=2859228 RepID=UPI001C615334|nr:hypothetical protein [Paenibacillus sp. R14(2021)]
MSYAVTWREYGEQGFTCYVGENECLRVVVVPERGSRIVSLLDKRTGREWIHRTDRPWEPQRYGMNWDDGDRGGWDEMFPTINPSPCPDVPWQAVLFPDHGEVWCIPWACRLEGERLHLEVEGVQVPYRLSKTIELRDHKLQIDYQLHNDSPYPFSYLWAAHPLLNIRPGMKLVTEPPEGMIQIAYSHGDRLGKQLDLASFPAAAAKGGETVDLSTLEGEIGAAEKYYFTAPLSEGYAGVSDPETGESLVFRFDPEETPYLAVWANYGGFNDYTFAVEPASGYMDSVQEAHKRGKVKQVLGHDTNQWKLEVAMEPMQPPR